MKRNTLTIAMAVTLLILSVASLFVGVIDTELTELLKGNPEVIKLFLVSRVPRLLAILCTGVGLSTAYPTT